MRWSNCFHVLVLVAWLTAGLSVFAQTPETDLGQLPISPTPEQFTALTNPTPRAVPGRTRNTAAHRRPAPAPPLTAKQIEYQRAVRSIGKDDHRFVHVELVNGKVQMGAIIAFDDLEFQLRNGILHSNRIEYSQLKSQPRRVPAVGTHIGNGFKWAGLGTTIGVAFLLAIPAIVVFLPLIASGAMAD